MRDSDIMVKTSAGQHELSARQHKLHARARSVLIAIHGELSVAELRRQFSALGDVDAILRELQTLGLVAPAKTGAVPGPKVAANDGSAALEGGLTPAQLTKQFMNESAVAAIGPWPSAFLFTLKLEHCYSPDELRGLMPEYRRVVGKAKGEDFAATMTRRIESLLRG